MNKKRTYYSTRYVNPKVNPFDEQHKNSLSHSQKRNLLRPPSISIYKRSTCGKQIADLFQEHSFRVPLVVVNLSRYLLLISRLKFLDILARRYLENWNQAIEKATLFVLLLLSIFRRRFDLDVVSR